MLAPSKYFVGAAVSLSASFTNSDVTPSDPDTVTLNLRSPNCQSFTYVYGTDANVTRQSAGNYAAIVTPNCAGRWFTRWEGTDPDGNVIAIEGSFNVQASRFVDHDCCCRDYR